MDISKFRATKDASDEDAWTKWLADEDTPPPNATAGHTRASKPARSALDFRNPQPTRTQSRTQKQAPAAPESFSINIQMPRVSGRAVRTAWHRSWPWLVGCVGIAGALYGGNVLMDYLQDKNQQPSDLTPVNTRAAVDLGYKPIVPDTSDREEDSQMPSEPVYYAEQKVYSFTDSYNGVNITVDQQALPDSFRDNPDAILDVAESINATDNFTTTLGMVYIFTSPNSGAQRLVLANDKMLMFLQSTSALDNSDWVTYIQALR